MSKDSTKQILRELKKLRKELGGRLDHLESRIDDISGTSAKPRQTFDAPPISQSSKANGVTSRQSFTGPTERDVTVKIQPLNDLGMARVVESAPVSYTHLRAHETVLDLVCRLLLEKKNNRQHRHTAACTIMRQATSTK